MLGTVRVIVMVSHVSGRWAFLDDDASHFQFVMTDTAEGGKSMGVLNEGHDTLTWVLLTCNQISNDVRGRIAKKSISSLRSVKIQACIDLLIPTLKAQTFRINHFYFALYHLPH